MIKILLTATGLTPSITINDANDTLVVSNTMTELSPSNDGRFWYGYTFNGTAGLEYRIIIDAGSAIKDPSLRYFDFWTTEGELSMDQNDRLYGTATRGDVNYTPAITYDEKQKIFEALDELKKRPTPVFDISPVIRSIDQKYTETQKAIGGLAKKEDLKVSVNIAPDERIGSIVNAISGLSEYMKPDENIQKMVQTLEALSKKEMDKEAIESLYEMVKGLPVDHIDEIKKQFMDEIKSSLEEIITQEIVKSVMKESVGALMDKMMKGKDDTPLHEKLFNSWK